MLDQVDGDVVRFRPDLAANLDAADKVYLRIRKMIDDYIAKAGIDAPPAPPYTPPWTVEEEPRELNLRASNINAVIWSTGFRADFSMVDVPVFNGSGYPSHHRGVTAVPGLYVLGLGWLWTWGSGRFSGIAQDAEHVVETIAKAFLVRQPRRRSAAARGLSGPRRPPLARLRARTASGDAASRHQLVERDRGEGAGHPLSRAEARGDRHPVARQRDELSEMPCLAGRRGQSERDEARPGIEVEGE